MTISKKLFIAITLALGIQMTAGAFFNDTQDQKDLILTFAQDLSKQHSRQARTVAQWLNEQVVSNSYDYYQPMINIIQNHSLTTESKLTLLSAMIKQQKSYNRRRGAQQFVNDACAFTLCAGVCALTVWAIIEDIKNPRPRVYYPAPKPRVTITYTQKYPSWPY